MGDAVCAATGTPPFPQRATTTTTAKDSPTTITVAGTKLNLIHFAFFRKHIGLYPGNEATAAFAEKLADFEVSKGMIMLPNDRDLPEKLFAEIAE